MKKAVEVYTKVLSEILDNTESFDSFVEDLTCLKLVFQAEVSHFFASPIISIEEKQSLLKKTLNTAHPLILNFFCVLVAKRSFHLWEDILQRLLLIKKEKKGLIQAEVESAQKLRLEVKQKIQDQLGFFFNKTVELKEKVSFDFIGGLRIKAMGFVFDDTILFHLKQMENQIKKGFYGYKSK